MKRVILGPNALVTFDGEVVEVFGSFGSVPSLRFHISNVKVSAKDPNRKGVRDATVLAGNNIASVSIAEECWPPFAQLMGEITAAQQAWLAGPQ